MIRVFLTFYLPLAALALGFYALSDRPGGLQPRMQYLRYAYVGEPSPEGLRVDYLSTALGLPAYADAEQIRHRLEDLGLRFPPDTHLYTYYVEIMPKQTGPLSLAMANTPENHERLIQEILRQSQANATPTEAKFVAEGFSTWDPLWYRPRDKGREFGIQEHIYYGWQRNREPQFHQRMRTTTLSLGDWRPRSNDPFTPAENRFPPNLTWEFHCPAWSPLLVLTLIPALILSTLRKPLARAVRFLPRPAQKR